MHFGNWYYRDFPKGEERAVARYVVIDRHDGFSLPPFASCNVGLRVGDNNDIVLRNRLYIQNCLQLDALVFARQVHGTRIVDIETQTVDGYKYDLGGSEGCDSLVTCLPGIGLAVQHADCQAVLFYDPVQAVIAAVHCGWRGSVKGILLATIRHMQRRYAVDPANLRAFIGPSLGPCCAEFINYRQELPERFYRCRVDKTHFDFHAVSKMQLVDAGLSKRHLQEFNICTSCSPDYFSYRRACREGRRQTGRNCTVIFLT